MNRQILISLLLICFFNENLFSQMKLSAGIHGQETEKVQVDNVPAIVIVNKSDYKGVCNFDLLLTGGNSAPAYKRTIEFTDDAGASLYTLNESKDSPGVYKIDLSGVCDKIASQKIIKIILLENPANDLMMLPSKMKQLAEIHLK